jgi:hypothetical protein
MKLLASRRRRSLDDILRLEYSARRLLGQTLDPSRWEQMTFNDKIAYRRLRVRDPLIQQFSDKLAMREYVTHRLGEHSLPSLLRVGDHPSQFSDIEGPYVLKANHGSGMVLTVDEKASLSAEQGRRAESWLSIDYCWDDLEWGYLGSRRLLLAEEFLHLPHERESPPDFKFFTFSGVVEMIQVDTGRFSDHRRMLRRPDWTPLRGTLGAYRNPDDLGDAKPLNLDTMLSWAAELGRGLDFVRVDLYDLGDRVFVGELTPYPNGGHERFRPRRLDAWLGQMWQLPSNGAL